MKRTLLLLLSLINLFACTQHRTLRGPASVDIDYLSPDLLQTTERVRDLIQTEDLPLSACHNEIADTFQALKKLPSNYFNTNYTVAEYGVIIERLWEIKQGIRTQVQNWSSAKVMDRDCAIATKAAMRATRYIEDFASLIYLKKKNGKKLMGLNIEDKKPMFSKSFPYSMSDDEDFNSKKDLKSGDLLLWRSTTAISASIARLGDSENNFSHVSIIYIDPKTGKRWNIESLIETGIIMEEYHEKELHPGVSKLVVFRHKNAKVAKKAAEFAYKLATATIGTKDHIIYDFEFDLDNHDKIFCSELIHMAFKHASKGDVRIPQFLTHFNMKNRKFLNDMGTDAQTGFQPGDIELEPSFDMVAEWRNYDHVRANQLKDIILSRMYRWMDDYQYQFKWNSSNVLGTGLFGFRRIPLLGGLLRKKLPKNMSAKTLKNVLTLQKVAGKLFDEMKDKLYEEDEEVIYSVAHIEEVLEDFRQNDLEKYKKQVKANRNGKAYANPKFHHLFGPSKKTLK